MSGTANLETAFREAADAGLPLGRVVGILWPEAIDAPFNPYGGMWRRLTTSIGDWPRYELRARRGGGSWWALSTPLPDAVALSWERSEFTIGGKCHEVRLFRVVGNDKAAKPSAAMQIGVSKCRTGEIGRPPIMPIILAEMKRRAKCGEMITTSLAAEARELVRWWMAAKDADDPPLNPHTIQNQLGKEWKELGGSKPPTNKISG